MLRRSAAFLAEHSGTVGIINYQHGAMFPAELDQVGQLGNSAFHREHAIGDDHLDSPVAGGAQLRVEVAQVAMLIHCALTFRDRLGQPDRIDDRGMIQLIADDQIVFGE